MERKGSILSAALLIVGYCIGTGFYALPIQAGPAGFGPASLSALFVWVYLVATGLLFLEATLACPDGSHVISICNALIGKTGMVLAALAFLVINIFFLGNFYQIGVEFLHSFATTWLDISLPKALLYLLLTLIFGGVVFAGTYASDRLNFILVVGLIVTLFAAVYLGSSHVEIKNLKPRQWYSIVFSVPFFVTAFDYQSMIPTLSTYLKRDRKKLIWMILIALLFPIIIYLTWMWLVIGSTSPGILWQANESIEPIFLGGNILKLKAPFHIFSNLAGIFALTSSLLATGLATVDFFGDAFKIPVDERKGVKRGALTLGVYGLGLIASFLIPLFTLHVINLSVGFAEVIFNALIPIWLIVRARYILKLDTSKCLPGGPSLLVVLVVASFFLIYFEGIQFVNW